MAEEEVSQYPRTKLIGPRDLLTTSKNPDVVCDMLSINRELFDYMGNLTRLFRVVSGSLPTSLLCLDQTTFYQETKDSAKRSIVHPILSRHGHLLVSIICFSDVLNLQALLVMALTCSRPSDFRSELIHYLDGNHRNCDIVDEPESFEIVVRIEVVQVGLFLR